MFMVFERGARESSQTLLFGSLAANRRPWPTLVREVNTVLPTVATGTFPPSSSRTIGANAPMVSANPVTAIVAQRRELRSQTSVDAAIIIVIVEVDRSSDHFRFSLLFGEPLRLLRGFGEFCFLELRRLRGLGSFVFLGFEFAKNIGETICSPNIFRAVLRRGKAAMRSGRAARCRAARMAASWRDC